jgi:hypothetical protein
MSWYSIAVGIVSQDKQLCSSTAASGEAGPGAAEEGAPVNAA